MLITHAKRRYFYKKIELCTKRLNVDDIKADDCARYYALCSDEELNKWWGYDYKTDLGEFADSPLPTDYFFRLSRSLANRKEEERSFAVRLNGEMIGELVIWNVEDDGTAENGFRFLKEFWGNGYASESVKALVDFELNTLKMPAIKMRCFKGNERSNRLIERLEFNLCGCDESCFYYIKERR